MALVVGMKFFENSNNIDREMLLLTTLFNISSKFICSKISTSLYLTGSIISGGSGRLTNDEIGSYSAIFEAAE